MSEVAADPRARGPERPAARSTVALARQRGPGYRLFHAGGRHGSTTLVPHFHDEYVICVQLRGHEECHVAGSLYGFDPGEIVLINPHQVHTGNLRGSRDVEYLSLYVEREHVRSLAAARGAASTPEFVRIKVSRDRRLGQELQALLTRDVAPSGDAIPADDDAATDVRLHRESAVSAVIAAALERHSNLREPRMRSSNRVIHRGVARALRQLHDLPFAASEAAAAEANTADTRLTVDALARTAGLSKYHFLRQFRDAVGMTPGAYLRGLRMCHAARLLRTTRRPVAEVGRASGFREHTSFSRAFRRHAGVTPRQFRARHGS